MGVFDYLLDLYESVSIQSAEAEEPQKSDGDNEESEESTKSDDGDDSVSEKGEGDGGEEESEEGGEEGGEEEEGEEGGEEEEEEEEEEEPEDIKPRLEEECMKTKECSALKHHYDECAERVQHQENQHGKAHEDCVEEFFHMMHCASQCAAPKLFRQLR